MKSIFEKQCLALVGKILSILKPYSAIILFEIIFRDFSF